MLWRSRKRTVRKLTSAWPVPPYVNGVSDTSGGRGKRGSSRSGGSLSCMSKDEEKGSGVQSRTLGERDEGKSGVPFRIVSRNMRERRSAVGTLVSPLVWW